MVPPTPRREYSGPSPVLPSLFARAQYLERVVIQVLTLKSAEKRTPPIDPAQLDRRADAELAVGRHEIAEALSHRAAEIREGAHE
jgi:hypothetical protein